MTVRIRVVVVFLGWLAVTAGVAGVGGLAVASPLAPDPALVREAVANLQAYLAIDTTNPPGNERRAAQFLAELLRREGIESQLIPIEGERVNLIARLPGTGRQRPVALLHHLDVVPADPAFWSLPPFGGQVRDGYIYGRGAIDIKGKGMIDLMTLVHLKRRGVRLSRDVLLLAVADEEEDSLGARHLVEKRSDLLRGVEFLIDEGQCLLGDQQGRPRAALVSLASKRPWWLTLTFRGPPGHGSVPLPDAAVHRLLRAANRLLAWRPPLRVRPELRRYVALHLEDKDPALLRGIRVGEPASWDDPLVLRRLAQDPHLRAALGDTICLTQLQGSDKINSIANQARLGLDCRLFPDTDPAEFLAELRRIIADPALEVTIEVRPPASAATALSPADSAFMRSLERCLARRHPEVPVVPTILLSSTDSLYFSSLGIKCYGFEPYILPESEYQRAHGNDERLSLANLAYGISLLSDVLAELGRE